MNKVIITELDDKMRQILNSTEPPDVKAKLYANTVHRYKMLTKPTIKKVDNTESDVLQSVLPQDRYKARKILNSIKNNREASWTPSGELVYRQTVVPESNLSQLVNDALKSRTTGTRPQGWDEFAQSIKGVSPGILTNKRYKRSWIEY